MRQFVQYVAYLALPLAMAACGGGDSASADPTPTDEVTILSVTPATLSATGTSQVEVTFSYRLATKENGVVVLGYTQDIKAWRLSPTSIAVVRGSGTKVLVGTVRPIDYTTNSDFFVVADLFEAPIPPLNGLAVASRAVPLTSP